MSAPDKAIARSDLLQFQRFLNEQFMEVYRAEAEAQSDLLLSMSEKQKVSDIASELGLTFKAGPGRWFLRLMDLLHISTKADFEPVYLTHDWLVGFNHFRGEVYSVIDFGRFMGGEKTPVGTETRLVMLKTDEGAPDKDKAKIALLVNAIDLSHAADFTLIYRWNEPTSSWSIHEEVADASSFLDFSLLNDKEKKILENVARSNHKDGEFEHMSLVLDVFVDNYRPVFVVGTSAFLEDMATKKPF